jgi:hypothetical protein
MERKEQNNKPAITSFESMSLSTCEMRVKRLNDQRQEENAVLTLVMDFNAIAKAHDHLGKDLAEFKNWQHLTGPEVTVICWCALDRFHPEISLKEVRQYLSPAQSAEVCNMLLEMSFPGILDRIEKLVEDRQKNAEAEQAADPTEAGKS